MSDPQLDLLAERLRATGRVAIPVHELAAALRPTHPGDAAGTHGAGPEPTALARRLRGDPRFVVLDAPAALPGLDAWDPADRAAYAPALRSIQLHPTLVLLNDLPGDLDAGAPLEQLLRHTLLRIASLPVAPRLAAAAEEARAILAAVSRRCP